MRCAAYQPASRRAFSWNQPSNNRRPPARLERQDITASKLDRLEPALDAFLSFDARALQLAIDADPGLVDLRVRGNTLLELATQPSTGAVPPDVIETLISAGAELDRALNLAGCWNLPELATQLLAAGADPAARADAGITPLESAAMHGSQEVADVLLARGLHRNSLWLAAAAGLLDELRSWVAPSGALLKPAGEYRPNFADVGRPAGAAPTDDPAEILGEALVFAAANGRTNTLDYLHGAGVNIDARPYRNTTGLHLAIQLCKPEMVTHLLELGAATSIRDDQYDSDARGWAAACDDGTPRAGAVRALLDAR